MHSFRAAMAAVLLAACAPKPDPSPTENPEAILAERAERRKAWEALWYRMDGIWVARGIDSASARQILDTLLSVDLGRVATLSFLHTRAVGHILVPGDTLSAATGSILDDEECSLDGTRYLFARNSGGNWTRVGRIP